MLDFTTRKQDYERRVRLVQEDVLRMGALVENSFWLAQAALFERNLAAAEQIPQQDKQIDRYYRAIEQECLHLIALGGSNASNLRLLAAIMHLVRDLERIGDYAKNLGEIAIKLMPYHMPPFMTKIGLMCQRSRSMLAMSLWALANLDREQAEQVKTRDDAVDDDFDQLFQLLVAEEREKRETLLLLVLVIHHLERMADHATNIGQRVAYIVTGVRG
ncbi:MAG: phosphate signaling complex protein PhoU [Pseudanabaenaceae cyanobacterium SKYGB_i_bin29]|nr:phosphate signaling complex protein PhoU [Pseudanabaenaceae cyanobacterium SKYG29]MDW8420321.1 phosphate signaling complex protein PhoU [Pseudanabaenaceae cyanobacterium SKYGB_i_bin29]